MPASFRPADFLRARHRPEEPESQFVVLVLNTPIRNQLLFSTVCKVASRVYAADGGANRMFDLAGGKHGRDPHAIVGDLDSLRDDVKGYYQSRGASIVKDPDQYSTDFTKCLKHIIQDRPSSDRSRIRVLVWGSLGGRADQSFSLVHHLYLAGQDPDLSSKVQVYLITSQSIIFLLETGENHIATPRDVLEVNIGIVPVGKPAVISTKGLEWDVEDWKTEFGKQLSTSNHVESEDLWVKTDERVLFTVEICGHLQN